LSDREHEVAGLKAQLLVESRAAALGALSALAAPEPAQPASSSGNGAVAPQSKAKGRAAPGQSTAPPAPASAGPSPSAAVARLVRELQEALGQREFELRHAQERMALLEAQLAVARQGSERGEHRQPLAISDSRLLLPLKGMLCHATHLMGSEKCKQRVRGTQKHSLTCPTTDGTQVNRRARA
jgi:hypothetical protein